VPPPCLKTVFVQRAERRRCALAPVTLPFIHRFSTPRSPPVDTAFRLAAGRERWLMSFPDAPVDCRHISCFLHSAFPSPHAPAADTDAERAMRRYAHAEAKRKKVTPHAVCCAIAAMPGSSPPSAERLFQFDACRRRLIRQSLPLPPPSVRFTARRPPLRRFRRRFAFAPRVSAFHRAGSTRVPLSLSLPDAL